MNVPDASINSEETVHRRKRHAWIFHPWVRTALITCLVTIISALVTYTIVRLRATFVLEQQVAQQQAAVTQLQHNVEMLERMVEERFGLLEQTVWGDLDPKIRQSLARAAVSARKPPEAWSANRDRELRTRINSLERRLLWLEVR